MLLSNNQNDMKNILVTGASGYIGRHVVEKLLAFKCDITVIDRNPNRGKANVNVIKKDIFSSDISKLFNEAGKPDVCLHLAWSNGFDHKSVDHLKNLYPHFSFIKSLVDQGLKHVAVMGSMHEIGYWEGKIDENTPTNPQSLYGIAKNSLRQALDAYLRNAGVIFQWIRGYYVYGDDSHNNSLFTKLLLREQAGDKTFSFVPGNFKYDFISIDELSNQIAHVVLQDQINGIINCCSGKPTSLEHMVKQFIKERNLRIKPVFGAFPPRAYDSPIVYGDSSKIDKILKSQ